MKIVVLSVPKFFGGFLRMLFRIKKPENVN